MGRMSDYCIRLEEAVANLVEAEDIDIQAFVYSDNTRFLGNVDEDAQIIARRMIRKGYKVRRQLDERGVPTNYSKPQDLGIWILIAFALASILLLMTIEAYFRATPP